ncbi:dTDP-4-dehydrorhamnose reductase [Anaeromusa sp.]|uniref:dTDP-4-dehydrorhamnose reductase n=1 Tax=Anaeromusa sp. TaxID=1872520 RepID=UPI00260A795A|nr:dTDP-4-dehydrorhamnose reductase [Anaeromusa sp.]MDD3158343.1 dTDP-4-dehydrorhamnose reductase [Anaeromusa sp.]
MKILVTGGNGQLGRAFQQMQAQTEHEIIARDVDCLDITNQAQVFAIMEKLRPDAVVHGAAYTQVDLAESREDDAFRVNAVGTQNIAAACLEQNVKMVYVSTDYVFDGEKETAYVETDVVCPQSAYGRTKLAGEELAARICPRLFIARTAWLYGDGNNFVRTMRKLAAEKDELSVVHDQTGTPTYAVDLAQAILKLLPTAYYGTYHMTNSGQCTWYEFACEILRQSGSATPVRPVTTAEFVRPAKRPRHSVLRNYMLEQTIGDPFRPWQEGLAEYLRLEALR